jgi:hypothetical protein
MNDLENANDLFPKVKPLLGSFPKKDLCLYFVAGGLQVKVFVKSDRLLSGILKVVFDN